MKRSTFLLTALMSVSAILASAPAGAQATRTWVSGLGNDANPCSLTAPCKTFAGAISKTATGGEISALDPGGYGAVTITKSITIDGGGGQVASILAAGSNGIVISGAGAIVTLRNLRINGAAQSVTPGLNGIRLLSGAMLHIENCVIFGFSQNAIDINLNQAAAPRVFITDTTVSDSAGGVTARNTGSGVVTLTIHRGNLVQNSSFGLRADGSGGGHVVASLSDSYVSGNGTGVLASAGPNIANIMVTRSSVGGNVTNGLQATGPANFSNILVSNTLVTLNGTGLAVSGGGSIQTYKNNAVDSNSANGAFTSSIIPE
jgi:hypothetical protein